MPLNDLIAVGELDEPNGEAFWTRGEGADTVVLNGRPLISWNTAAWTCRLDRQEIVEIAATFLDPLHVGEFRVQLRGVVQIARGRERELLLARAEHGGIDLAAREALKAALIKWKGKGEFASKLFPAGSREANVGAVTAALEALRSIGLDIESARLEPFEWNSQDRVTLDLGPQRVQCSDPGADLSAKIRVDLVPDDTRNAQRLLSKDPTAGTASIKSTVETHVFNWLEGRYSQHQHTFEAKEIVIALEAEINALCGRSFGRKVSLLRLDNGIGNQLEPEDQLFEFPASYKIAANTASMEMIHRCRIAITDVGRAPGDLAQRQKEVEQRIQTAIQIRILAFSENKVQAELHTFRGTNANTLSEWTLADPTLLRELQNRGLTLRHLYVFTNVRKLVPDGNSFRHVTSYPIRGTKRVLTLSHDVIWKVGTTREQQGAYVECGAPDIDTFEKGFLAKELDAQTRSLLLAKPFGTIVFEYFQDQEKAEGELSEHLQKMLAAYANKYGVEVSTVTTVFDQVPEAALLRGAMIKVDERPYALSESSDKITLGATVFIGFPKGADGSLLKQHLSGDDSGQMIDKIKAGIRDQIEFVMAGVDPWEIFSMRGAQPGEDDASISARLSRRVDEWLGQSFGLQIKKSQGFVLQIGECSLLEARKNLIGLETEVLVTTKVLSKRLNWKIATEVGVEVGVKVPFRIAGVANDPEYSRRFMEALRSCGDAHHIIVRINEIIRSAISGLMQVMPLEAFIRSNFSLQSYRELIAGLSTYEVRNALGLEIAVSRHRVLPHVDGVVVSEDAIELQETLRVLTGLLAKEQRALTTDPSVIADLKGRITDIKSDLEAVANEQGVGGTLDSQALTQTRKNIQQFLALRDIPELALVDYHNSRAADDDGERKNEEDADGEGGAQ